MTTPIAAGLVDVDVRPAYGTATYTRVVFHGDKYRGWKCVHRSNGSLGFEHDDGRAVCFNHPNIPGWLKQCWDDFTRHAHKTPNSK